MFLAKLRGEPSFLWGDFKSIMITKHIFSFSRIAEGHTGYLIVMNLSKKDLTLNFYRHSEVPLRAKLVYFFGANPVETIKLDKIYKINQTVHTNKLFVKNKTCFILSF